jgi:hypothetical protein
MDMEVELNTSYHSGACWKEKIVFGNPPAFSPLSQSDHPHPRRSTLEELVRNALHGVPQNTDTTSSLPSLTSSSSTLASSFSSSVSSPSCVHSANITTPPVPAPVLVPFAAMEAQRLVIDPREGRGSERSCTVSSNAFGMQGLFDCAGEPRLMFLDQIVTKVLSIYSFSFV